MWVIFESVLQKQKFNKQKPFHIQFLHLNFNFISERSQYSTYF